MRGPASLTLPRVPRRIEPAAFYCDYLPQLWTAFAGELQWPSWQFSCATIIDDEIFSVSFDTGVLSGRVGMEASALTTLRCSRASWELAVWDVLPSVIRRANAHLSDTLDEATGLLRDRNPQLSPEALLAHPGTLQIRFEDDAGDQGNYTCGLGTADGPTAGVSITDADLWALINARGRIAALLKSRIIVDGNLAWLLRLAQIVEPVDPVQAPG